MIHHTGNPLRQPALEEPGDDEQAFELMHWVSIYGDDDDDVVQLDVVA